jgi:FkbM family methyltransferase
VRPCLQPLRETGEIFGNVVVASAFFDRLVHHAIVVHIEGLSSRLRQHAQIAPNIQGATADAAEKAQIRKGAAGTSHGRSHAQSSAGRYSSEFCIHPNIAFLQTETVVSKKNRYLLSLRYIFTMLMRRIAQKLESLQKWRRSAGWRGALSVGVHRARRAFGLPEPSTLRLRPRHAMHPVLARLGGSSDLDVFRQIFIFDEYSCVRDIHSPYLIFDLGANVGYSSAYLLSKFPTAAVVAVEPDPANFELCRKNLAPYGDRAQIVLGAAWSKRSKLALSRGTFGDGREWATEVKESQGNGDLAVVEGWDIPSLVRLTDKQQIDLLKVDIEGSEVQIFGANSSEWLPKVRNICIELHGRQCDEMFFSSLKDFEYELSHSGELTVCRNLRRK